MTRPVVMDVIARDKATGTFVRVQASVQGLAKTIDNNTKTMNSSLKGVSKSSSDAEAALHSFATRTSGALKSAAKVSAVAIGAVTLGLGAMAAGAIKTGLQTAAAMEQAQISFTTLLGSGQKAKKFLDDLAKFAAATPYTLPGLIDASRQLIGAGLNAKQAQDALQNFGDATSALGITQDGFNHIMLATSQALAAGTLHAGDLLQMTEAGLPVWKLLSEALHKPVAEVRKLSESGKLLTADVLPKLEAQMKHDYGGAMIKQSHTLAGLWSTLTDTFSQGMAKALIPLEPVLNKILPKATQVLSDALGWLGKKFAEAVTWVVDHWPEIQKTLTDVWTKIQPTLLALRDIFTQQIVPALKGAAVWAKDHLVPALAAIGDWISKHQTLVESFGVAVATMMAAFKLYRFIELTTLAIKGLTLALLANPITAAAVAILAIGTALYYAYKKSAEFRTGVKNAFADLKIWALEAAQALLRYLVIPVLDFFSTIIHGAAAAFGWVPDIGPKLKKARGEFDDWRKGVDTALSGIKVEIDKAQADQTINNLQLRIDQIKQKKVPGLTANNLAGKERIAELQAAIDAVRQGKTPPPINANTIPAKSVIATLQRQIDEIKQGFVPGINANTAKGQKALKDLQAQIDGLTGTTVPVKVVYTAADAAANRGPGGVTSQASGGRITGPGGPTSDMVPILASNGEYMMRAAAVNKYGLGFMENLNRGKFASGGPIILDLPTPSSLQPAADLTGLNLVKSLASQIVKQLATIPGAAVPAPGNISALQAYAYSLFPSYGWGAGALSSLIALWNGESGWNPNAVNPSSGAWGIPQSLPADKMASAGADWRTNGATQIRWGLQYINSVYGSPTNAYSAWLSRSPHWYGEGMPPTVFRRPTLIGVGEHGPETVSVSSGRYGGGGVVVAPGAITVYAARGQDERQIAAQAFTMLKAWVAEEERRAAKGGRA